MPRVHAVCAAQLALGLILTIPAVGDDRPEPAKPSSDLGFLEVGRAYRIRFPEDRHPVQLRESGIAAQPSGPPATWRTRYQIDVFVVRKLGSGSWALLEHPVDPKAATEYAAAQRLLDNKARVAELERNPERKTYLESRRKIAAGKLAMTQTWINLAHAISIADPPTEPPAEPRFNVEVK
ncbi:MAG: hypothetical protein U0794_10185 [Isosphaeraceae bacterium]